MRPEALRQERGQAVVEYALILALIAAVAVVVLMGLAGSIDGLVETIVGALT